MSTSVGSNTFICAAFANTLSLTIIVVSLLSTTVAQTQPASNAVATVPSARARAPVEVQRLEVQRLEVQWLGWT